MRLAVPGGGSGGGGRPGNDGVAQNYRSPSTLVPKTFKRRLPKEMPVQRWLAPPHMRRLDPVSVFTSYLYAVPTFVEGVARLFDFAGLMTEYNTTRSPEQADARAMTADVLAVLSDMRTVVGANGGMDAIETKSP